MKYSVTIELKKFAHNASTQGHIIKQGRRKFLIQINTRPNMVEWVGTLLHEIGHLVFWIMFGDESDQPGREHEFCDALDRCAVRSLRKFMGIN